MLWMPCHCSPGPTTQQKPYCNLSYLTWLSVWATRDTVLAMFLLPFVMVVMLSLVYLVGLISWGVQKQRLPISLVSSTYNTILGNVMLYMESTLNLKLNISVSEHKTLISVKSNFRTTCKRKLEQQNLSVLTHVDTKFPFNQFKLWQLYWHQSAGRMQRR